MDLSVSEYTPATPRGVPSNRRRRLGEILVERGVLSQTALDTAIAKLAPSPGLLGEALLGEGVVTEEQLAQALAQQFGLDYDPLHEFRIPQHLQQLIPLDLLQRYPCLPIEERPTGLRVAITAPQHLSALDDLELLLRRPIEPVVSTKSAIHTALTRFQGTGSALKNLEAEYRSVLVKENEHGEELLSVEKLTKDASPVIRLVDTILWSAIEKRASDIHIEAGDHGGIVRFRVDGILTSAMDALDPKMHAPVISRLKVMSELDIAERRVPQDGRFRMRLEHKTVDFRVSVMPSVFGESVVIRILDRESMATGLSGLSLDQLGFHPDEVQRFRKGISKPYGMVLVTGPTGSGKTTTLYAAISELNTKEDKVITIEDPVEYQLPSVVQIQVNEKTGLTFARGLRSVLRHDPDKIMVGEIRDAETAQIAIQAAQTGHLVFTTVHANNAFDVIGRFVNMGIDPYNFVSALNSILAQRLVRLICPSCREEVPLDQKEAEASGLDYERNKEQSFFRGRGCPECLGTGYRGRHCIAEFLELSDQIKGMILSKRPPYEIRTRAIEEGMVSLRMAAMEKVLKGETTLREINRITMIDEF
jgi:type IV pilus assembly protein PilB